MNIFRRTVAMLAGTEISVPFFSGVVKFSVLVGRGDFLRQSSVKCERRGHSARKKIEVTIGGCPCTGSSNSRNHCILIIRMINKMFCVRTAVLLMMDSVGPVYGQPKRKPISSSPGRSLSIGAEVGAGVSRLRKGIVRIASYFRPVDAV